MGSGGVISIKVLDKNWKAVSGASVNIADAGMGINLTRTTASDGTVSEIGLPPDSNYHIVVTKNGYSTDQTYPTSLYPSAKNPDVTVIKGLSQSVTFMIDQLSNLIFYTLDRQTCQEIPGVGLNIQGAKTIDPADTPKFNKDYTTDGNGAIYPTSTSPCSSTCGAANCCLEWDIYAPTVAGNTYMVYGTSPVQSVDLLPNTSQNFNLILGPGTANQFLGRGKRRFWKFYRRREG